MADPALRIAIVAGEESGDALGGDLIDNLKSMTGRDVELIGVGGSALQARGLKSLIDPHDITLMGFSAVIRKLPSLLMQISRVARTIAAAKPDCLIIIDSPDFTHRVARKVKARLPSLPVIDYVAPSVWAWRPGRAKAMTAYVDLVLAILPFEPKAIADLGGPACVYVGHPLTTADSVAGARARQETRKRDRNNVSLLLLPGSRRGEIERMLPVFGETVSALAKRGREWRVVIPTFERFAETIRQASANWPLKVEVVTAQRAKWRAFGEADAALAASGTVLLELSLAGVPSISAYRTDRLVRLAMSMIKAWSGALPNLIADYPVIPEFYNEYVRPDHLARELERIATDSPERFAQLAGFGHVRAAMATTQPSGMLAARAVLDRLKEKTDDLSRPVSAAY